LYTGIPDALAAIAFQVEALFVVTSKPQIFAETIVQHFDLAPFFRRVYGSQLDGKRADKGDLIAYVLRQEGIAPAEGVMVGDRCYDILGARNNNVPAIGVLWGYGSPKELEAAAPNYLCKSPDHLPQQVVKALI
jgi:phosphoglycolate phosphatase